MLSTLTFHHSFTHISGYRTPIGVILIGLESLLKDLQLLIYLRGQILTILTAIELGNGQKKKFDSAPCAIVQGIAL